jgi:hypothetical protein
VKMPAAARKHSVQSNAFPSRAAGFLTLFFALAVAGAAPASAAGDVPSCYAANKLPAPSAEREIFVVIDQTTLLNADLRQSVMSNVGGFMQPGTAFVIATFSAFAQARFLTVTKAGTLEAGLSTAERNGVKVRVLETFDACMSGQWNFGLRVEAAAITAAMAGASSALVRSDVLATVRAMSDVVRASKARERVVLIVSDMLENSSVSSFYSNHQNVRSLNTKTEMNLAKSNDMIGNFDGARVYVIGAGIVPEKEKKGIYRDPKTMRALKNFWVEYFKASNADLVEFGQPALLNPIR